MGDPGREKQPQTLNSIQFFYPPCGANHTAFFLSISLSVRFLYLVDFFLHFTYIVLLNWLWTNYTVQDTKKTLFF